MKKVLDLVKQFVAIVFGALIILCYLNDLSVGGTATVRAVFAFLVGSYFILIGLLGMLCKEQIGEKALKIMNGAGMAAYASLFFLIVMLDVIDLNAGYGVNGWVIADFALTVSIAFAVLYIIVLFVNNRVVIRLANLFGMLFLLAIVLYGIVFTPIGNRNTLANIALITLIIRVTYASIYLGNIKL